MFRKIALLLAFATAMPAARFHVRSPFRTPLCLGHLSFADQLGEACACTCFLWNAQGQAFRDLYAYNADTKTLKRLTDLEGLKDPINDSEIEHDPHRVRIICAARWSGRL